MADVVLILGATFGSMMAWNWNKMRCPSQGVWFHTWEATGPKEQWESSNDEVSYWSQQFKCTVCNESRCFEGSISSGD